MFSTILFRATGVNPPAPPDPATTSSTVICDPAKICPDIDFEATPNKECSGANECVENVKRMVNGEKYVFMPSYENEKSRFVAQHIDEIQEKFIDKTIKAYKNVRSVYNTAPKPVLICISVVLFALFIIAFIPFIVHIIVSLKNKVVLSKYFVVLLLAGCIVIAYFLIPL